MYEAHMHGGAYQCVGYPLRNCLCIFQDSTTYMQQDSNHIHNPSVLYKCCDVLLWHYLYCINAVTCDVLRVALL